MYTKPEPLFNGADRPPRRAVGYLFLAALPDRQVSPLHNLPLEIKDMVLGNVSMGLVESARVGCLLSLGSVFRWESHGAPVQRKRSSRRDPGFFLLSLRSGLMIVSAGWFISSALFLAFMAYRASSTRHATRQDKSAATVNAPSLVEYRRRWVSSCQPILLWPSSETAGFEYLVRREHCTVLDLLVTCISSSARSIVHHIQQVLFRCRTRSIAVFISHREEQQQTTREKTVCRMYQKCGAFARRKKRR